MRSYLMALLIAAAFTHLLTPFARALALRAGAMTAVRDRDVHDEPIPRWGGIAMLGGVLAAFVAVRHLPLLASVFAGPDNDLRAIFAGAAVVCLVGVVDDRWGLDALTKFAGQVLAAGVMVLQGVQLQWLPFGDSFGAFVLPREVGAALTILVVVVAINAVNFIDGLDGLLAGVLAIAGAAFFLYCYLVAVQRGVDRATTAAVVAAVLVGVCLGFLPHNVHHARLFMGDAGSMLLGLLFASSAIAMTGQLDPNALSGSVLAPTLLPLVLPIAILAIPLLDLLLAVVRRTRAGTSPFAPDKQHLHHRLLEIGHSQRRAVAIMYVWTAVVAFGTVGVAFVSLGDLLLLLVGALVVAVVITVKLPRLHARPS